MSARRPTDLKSSRGTPHDPGEISQGCGRLGCGMPIALSSRGGTRMRFARILVPMAAAFWATATIVTADQHAHAPVPHPTQTHGRPATITPSTQTGGTHHDGDHHSGAHHEVDHHSGAHHEVDHHSGAHHEVDHHSGPHTPPPSTVATKIQSHPKLAAKVTAMLPPGMTMNQAARGFKNQGQFIAALHASQRTGIPFSDLRRAMVMHHESLGQAIHSLRPSANGSREAQHAEHEAG